MDDEIINQKLIAVRKLTATYQFQDQIFLIDFFSFFKNFFLITFNTIFNK